MIYLDTSALVKLVKRELATDALLDHLRLADPAITSSTIAMIELAKPSVASV